MVELLLLIFVTIKPTIENLSNSQLFFIHEQERTFSCWMVILIHRKLQDQLARPYLWMSLPLDTDIL